MTIEHWKITGTQNPSAILITFEKLYLIVTFFFHIKINYN